MVEESKAEEVTSVVEGLVEETKADEETPVEAVKEEVKEDKLALKKPRKKTQMRMSKSE